MSNKEIIILVILGCLPAWGTYSPGVWLIGGFVDDDDNKAGF